MLDAMRFYRLLISRVFSCSSKVFFPMKRETRRAIKELAYYSSIGLSVALSIFIGLAVGVYLDRRVFNTTPWFTLICLGLGIAAGYRNIGLAIKKSRKL
jgi:ATP synthase protein I